MTFIPTESLYAEDLHSFTQLKHYCSPIENLTDEERIWEEIHEIKTMPVSMAQKREMKAQLQNANKLRLQGLDQIKWQRRKVFKQFQAKWSEYLAKMELWRKSLKTIEGNCGTGVVAYFIFLRWLIMLNLSIFIIILLFIVLPQTVFTQPEIDTSNCDVIFVRNQTSTECCHAHYMEKNNTGSLIVLDLIQGTGFMEKTLMFYGMYSNRIFGYSPSASGHDSIEESSMPPNDTFESTSTQSSPAPGSSTMFSNFFYDLPLAYVSVTLVYLLMSLMAIMRSVSREFKDRMVEGEGQFYQYCNLIFGGWDFCIHNEKSALIKHKALLNEIKGLLQSKRIEYERCNRSRDVMFKLIIIRLFVNLIVCIILLAAAILIYFAFNKSLDQYLYIRIYKLNGTNTESGEPPIQLKEAIMNLLYEFLPYVTIVCMNFLVPLLFNYLVQFEQYSPMFVIKITLLRTVFLRLSSLAVLLSRFYYLIESPQKADESCKRDPLPCWETFVGQQFYKLLVVDFVTHFFVTFVVNFPRAMLARHINSKFTRFIGEQEFELSKHVLDIVYSQTLCWLGTFYSPFVPAIAVVLHFFMFYIKKFACLINSKPSAILYRTSRSNSLFMAVLLVSYAMCVIPIVYAAAEILPSQSCGPFRGLRSVWQAAIDAFLKLPKLCQDVIFFFGTAGFAVPCFVTLILFLYYYYAVSAANKHMVEMLKNQLVLEGHDKQFLLNRLSAFLKQQQQQQEYYKKIKHAEQQQHIQAPVPPARGAGNIPPPVAPHSKDFIKEKEIRERVNRNDKRESE